MPMPNPSRRDDMILPTFVDLEELLFSSMRLHETARDGTDRAARKATLQRTRASKTNQKAS
jgi:hypothetical protein